MGDVTTIGATQNSGTLDFWREKMGVAVDEEGLRQTSENLAGFFELLLQWQQGEDEHVSQE